MIKELDISKSKEVQKLNILILGSDIERALSIGIHSEDCGFNVEYCFDEDAFIIKLSRMFFDLAVIDYDLQRFSLSELLRAMAMRSKNSCLETIYMSNATGMGEPADAGHLTDEESRITEVRSMIDACRAIAETRDRLLQNYGVAI